MHKKAVVLEIYDQEEDKDTWEAGEGGEGKLDSS